MSVVCVTGSGLPHLADEPFLDKTKMGGEVSRPGRQGLAGVRLAAPPLPGLAVEAVTGEGTDWNAVGTSQRRVHIHHIDLYIGIARINADIHVDLAAVVAVGHSKA